MAVTVFVGDCNEELGVIAKQYDSNAYLVCHNNYLDFLNKKQHNVTIYTSLADLPKYSFNDSILKRVLNRANKIYYCPPDQWSDKQNNFSWDSLRSTTEFLVLLEKLGGKEVHGDEKSISFNSYLDLVDVRSTDDTCLWVAGGSDTAGFSISLDQRFGTLLGNRLGMPTYHLTMLGSSIEWAADQILRSDVRQNDIVIWGLVPEVRAPMAKNGSVGYYDSEDRLGALILAEETRLYKAITSVHQVLNFIRKIKCKLIILPMYSSVLLQRSLLDVPEFFPISVPTEFCDTGKDKLHPGPLQHKFYADFCYNQLHCCSGY